MPQYRGTPTPAARHSPPQTADSLLKDIRAYGHCGSVVDPHHVDADPDSTYHPDADPTFFFNANPDPNLNPDADPEPDSDPSFQSN